MKKVIDISEHNGEIDFAKVKSSGISDVIIRIGWIGNKENHTIDKMFQYNFMQARRYGFNIGIYVYSYCKSIEAIKSGCCWIMKLIEGKNLELPIFLDLEDETIYNTGNLTEQAIEFCRYFEIEQFQAGVYASKYWFNTVINPYILENYKIWLAEWYVEKTTVSFKVDLWQYTNKEKVFGINLPEYGTDCSKCFCETEEKENTIINNGDDEEVKTYKNGSTIEPIYSDTNLSNQIGYLNKYEQCECLGIFQNRAIVRYKIDNKENYKIGFAKWLGGIQN